MKKYKVEITETLQKIIEINSSSEEDAINQVRNDYGSEKITLDSNDFIEFEINTIKEL